MTTSLLRCFIPGMLCAISWANLAYSEQISAVPPAPIPQELSSLQRIGKITARSAKEIAASDWSIGCETLDRDLADFSKYKSHLGSLGAKAVRLQAGWAKTEKQPGVYDWKWLDEIIGHALSQGVQPWVELSYGNAIYEGGGGTTLGDGLPKSATALKAWDTWAKALVQRYKARISAWEIWNEPDLTKEVTAQEYAVFYIRTAELIRALQPEAKLYALGLAKNGTHAGFADAFLSAVAAQGKLGLVDAITFHGYPENPDDLSSYRKVKEVVEKYPAKIELRQGETGAPSAAASTGALSDFAWSELTQAKWDLRRMLAHHAVGVPVNLFTLSEFIYNDARRTGLNSKGLLRINPDKSVAYRKPAYLAAQNVYSIFDQSVTVDKGFAFSSNAAPSIAVNGYRKQPSGACLAAIWFNGAPAADSNHYTPVDFSFNGVQFKHPVYVDLRTGDVFEISASDWSNQKDGAQFRSIPVYDSPILIADKSVVLFK